MRNTLVFSASALGLLAFALGVGCGAKHSSDFGDDPDSGGGSALGDGGSSGALAGGDGGDGGGISGSGGPGEVYGHSDDTLYKLEPISKVVTTVGKFSCVNISCPDSGEGMWDIALDKDGNMYGSVSIAQSDCITFTGAIVKIDKSTANCTVVKTSSSTFPNSLSFVPAGTLDPTNEVLVGYDSDSYVRIDITSGAITTIGNLNGNPAIQGWQSSGDIVSIIGGKTYLTATLDPNSSANDSILEVDPVTGKALSVIGKVGFGKVWGLGFWAGT
ncbi:MAG: hypothetical protein ABI461_19675, partial [Polyangiaceae bacterium]